MVVVGSPKGWLPGAEVIICDPPMTLVYIMFTSTPFAHPLLQLPASHTHTHTHIHRHTRTHPSRAL